MKRPAAPSAAGQFQTAKCSIESMKKIALSLVLLGPAGVNLKAGCQSSRTMADPACAAEIELKLVQEQFEQRDRDLKAQKALQQRQFVESYNRLVDAISSFAAEYNAGNGQVWPQRQVEKLRKAMRDLQSMERSLNDNPRR